jgi:arginyl-tRNA synthetase
MFALEAVQNRLSAIASPLPHDAVEYERLRLWPDMDAAEVAFLTNLPALASAADLNQALDLPEVVLRVETLGNGVARIILARGAVERDLAALAMGRAEPAANGRKAIVEFVSTYPNSPLLARDARAAVLGDAIASLLECDGWTVWREFYCNDIGQPIDTLARIVYSALPTLGEQSAAAAPVPEFIRQIAADLLAKHGSGLAAFPEEQWLPVVRAFAVERILDGVRSDLATLGVKMDGYRSEQVLHSDGSLNSAMKYLDARRVLVPRLTKRNQPCRSRRTVLRLGAGAEILEQPVTSASGNWTYFASDVAYSWDKISRGFDRIVNVFRTDHAAYAPKTVAVIRAIAGDAVLVTNVFVSLTMDPKEGSKPHSDRPATAARLSLSELIAQHDPTALRFWLLQQPAGELLRLPAQGEGADSAATVAFATVQFARNLCAAALRRSCCSNDPSQSPALSAKLLEWPTVRHASIASLNPARIADYMFELANFVVTRLSAPGDLATAHAQTMHAVLSEAWMLIGLPPEGKTILS